MNSKTKFQNILVLLVLISFVGSIVSGVIVSRRLFAFLNIKSTYAANRIHNQMVCSLRLCIATWQIKIKAQPTEIFSVSCAFFSFINHLFINDFCCSVANNYRLYFQNLFSYRSLLVFGNFIILNTKRKDECANFRNRKRL